MARLEIQGGQRLSGRVRAAGAKNSVIKLMAASILFEAPITLTNVPHLRDVKTMASLLEHMGATCVWNGREGLSIAAGSLAETQAPYHLVRTMRASFNVLGPLIARYGQAEVSLPGGCAIGTRPVDQHLAGLAALGASVAIESGYVRASAEHGLIGTDFSFDFPSVGATEHVLMAAVLAKGQTRLSGCAREPEIVDLAAFLNQAGARIRGAGTSEIEINGVGSLAPINYEVMSDRIEAATYLMAAIATGGEVAVDGLTVDHLPTVVELLRATGVTVEKDKNAVAVSADAGALTAQSFDTAPFPGFPTDLQAQMMVVNSLASGRSHIRETIFENRFMHVQELVRMGANIKINGNVALIEGVKELNGAEVMATDLRASVSLVLAGLIADKRTIVNRIYHLDRGYEFLERKLKRCNAEIKRI